MSRGTRPHGIASYCCTYSFVVPGAGYTSFLLEMSLLLIWRRYCCPFLTSPSWPLELVPGLSSAATCGSSRNRPCRYRRCTTAAASSLPSCQLYADPPESSYYCCELNLQSFSPLISIPSCCCYSCTAVATSPAGRGDINVEGPSCSILGRARSTCTRRCSLKFCRNFVLYGRIRALF